MIVWPERPKREPDRRFEDEYDPSVSLLWWREGLLVTENANGTVASAYRLKYEGGYLLYTSWNYQSARWNDRWWTMEREHPLLKAYEEFVLREVTR